MENTSVFYPNTIDGHVHLFGNVIEGVDVLLKFQKQFGYAASNYLSCEAMGDASQNALGIYWKLVDPNNYAFGGLHYRYEYPLEQEAKRLMEIGFDGMKMIENKPNLRKRLKLASNAGIYDEFYSFMEREQVPMIVHVADPEEFWDEAAIPSWAVKSGFFYGDGTFVSKETIYEEVFDVLDRFPKLRITFAHFFFMSGDLNRLTKLMEKYPRMGLDIVSGTEMYFNFTKDPVSWREFFLKYQDRIIFGTDNVNMEDPVEIANALIVNSFEHEFIRTDKDIPAWDKQIKGIALPPQVQEKIFRTNFQGLAGEKPKKINIAAAISYLEDRLADGRLKLTERESKLIKYVLDYCKK